MPFRIFIASSHPYARFVICEELILAGHSAVSGRPQDDERCDLLLVGPGDVPDPGYRQATLLCWQDGAGAQTPLIDVDRPFDAILSDIEALAGGGSLPVKTVPNAWAKARARAARHSAVAGIARGIETAFGNPVRETSEGLRAAIRKYLGDLNTRETPP